MKHFKIKKRESDSFWLVYSGYYNYGNFIPDQIEFWSSSIADCYAWIKATKENLITKEF